MADLSERLISELTIQEGSINELRLRLGCRKNDLIAIYKRLLRQGVIGYRKEGTKVILFMKNRERSILEGFDYLKNSRKLIQIHLDAIEDLKKAGKRLQEKDESGKYWMSPEPKEYADKIIGTLRALNDICMSYHYLKDFGYAKDYSAKELQKVEKECIDYTKTILKRLKRHLGYFYHSYIGSDLFCLKERIKLDEYFRDYELIPKARS
jgi:hypothetical protein